MFFLPREKIVSVHYFNFTTTTTTFQHCFLVLVFHSRKVIFILLASESTTSPIIFLKLTSHFFRLSFLSVECFTLCFQVFARDVEVRVAISAVHNSPLCHLLYTDGRAICSHLGHCQKTVLEVRHTLFLLKFQFKSLQLLELSSDLVEI